ncbi:MAG: GSCFA domain-containing protein [Acidimicrobiia bacterium]|nr:GSCFA domain-containing protein [Acidimicrobiia bacterium]
MSATAREAPDATHIGHGDLELVIGDDTDPWWSPDARAKRITARRSPVIHEGASVFTIGSCFAAAIRKALRQRGFDVTPRFDGLPIDNDRQVVGYFGRINHYDTFSIRNTFLRAMAAEPEQYDPLPVKDGWTYKFRDWQPAFQDPRRQHMYGIDEAAMRSGMAIADEALRGAVATAEVYVITLGLTETWWDDETGTHVWSSTVPTASPTPERFSFRATHFPENHDNVRSVCAALTERYPDRQIILTVSPVPLQRTYTDDDVVVANTYSKSVLRAVAGAVAAEFDQVTYWPSYEIALATDLFQPDGRHITPEGVGAITDAFLAAHCS